MRALKGLGPKFGRYMYLPTLSSAIVFLRKIKVIKDLKQKTCEKNFEKMLTLKLNSWRWTRPPPPT